MIIHFRSESYSRTFLKVRRYCRGLKRAQNRAEIVLRHLRRKSRHPATSSSDLLEICRNVLRVCKLQIHKNFVNF